MPTHKQLTTESSVTVTGLGAAGSGDLKTLFAASPLYDGTYTEAKAKELFEDKVLSPVVNDGGHTFGVFNRDYADAPKIADVKTGGGGLPGTPYAPNIASVREGDTHNPKNIPEDGAEATARQPHGGGAFQGDGLASPNDTSAKISSQNRKLGDLIFGRSHKV